jgi:F420-dependent oxidoreductase-like protein
MRLRIFVEPQEGASYEDQLAMALAAEAAGFDAFFRSDHFMSFFGGSGQPGPTDSWLTLAALARETSTIRLGTMVTSATFRPPGLLAVSVAQVDQMSGGRIELGLGAGWHEGEHRAHAVDFPTTSIRFDRLEEQLAIISGMWATPVGERFSFSGQQYDVRDSPALPKPLQSPAPPIIVGGAGARRTPALAARFAQEFNTPFLQPDQAADQFARVAAACEAIGRDPATMRMSSAIAVCCGEDERSFERRASATGLSAEMLRAGGAAGLPGEVAERLSAWREAGAETAYLQLLDLRDLDQLRLIAAEVLPLLAGDS